MIPSLTYYRELDEKIVNRKKWRKCRKCGEYKPTKSYSELPPGMRPNVCNLGKVSVCPKCYSELGEWAISQ